MTKKSLSYILLSMFCIGCAEATTTQPECETNACGSCGALNHAPNDVCEGGTWQCNSKGNIECVPTPSTNPCGGTTRLDLHGTDCGDCGTYQCDGLDALKCDDPGKNACGACDTLEYAPGDPCQNGTWTCDNDGKLICKETIHQQEPNACGGMTEIGTLGTDCGVCGKYECAGPDALKCNDPGKNACGGCDALLHQPDEPCGDCGKYTCDTTDSVICDDPGKNACGGCTPLTAIPDTPCGNGECATWTCDGTENIICGSHDMNACGGCDTLDHLPGDPCEGDHACCTWQCDDHGGITKDDQPENACGGCGTLDHIPSTPCENGYGIWTCDPSDADKNTLTCTCDTHNECGGCDLSQNLGDRCWMCDHGFDGDSEGTIECHGETMFCKDSRGDTPKTAFSFGTHKDSEDDTFEWADELQYDDDTDFYYFENVEDVMFGMLKPEFWIPYDRGFKLCVYIHENRSPASVSYTCSGTGQDEVIGKMTVSATEPAQLVLGDGTVYTGFCTKPSDTAEYKYIQISGFKSTATNSFSAYLSVSSDGTNTSECRQYYLRYRF